MDQRVVELLRAKVSEPNLGVGENPLVVFLSELKEVFDADVVAARVAGISVSAVTFDPEGDITDAGASVQAKATVTSSVPGDFNRSVTWSINPDGGAVSIDEDTGVLTVDEGATDANNDEFTVTATSVVDPAKSGAGIINLTLA